VTFDNWIPLLIVIIPLFVAVIIFALAEDKTKTRSTLNIGASLISLVLVGLMLWGVFFTWFGLGTASRFFVYVVCNPIICSVDANYCVRHWLFGRLSVP